MKRKTIIKVGVILSTCVIFYWLPLGIISLNGRSSTVSSIDRLPDSDAVIIFGTLVRGDGEITPLLKERLEAGKQIIEAGKSAEIVVSNTENAATVMAAYLFDAGVSSDLIEIDKHADKTPDTCVNEKKEHPEGRKIIFVSQGFHLPRILYQCGKSGVKGIAFPAEALPTIDRADYSFITKLLVRTNRYFREAGLTWLELLDMY